MVRSRSSLLRLAAAFTFAAGAFGLTGNEASAQIDLATGVAAGSTYTAGYVQVPSTVQSDTQLATYLTAHPVVAAPAFTAGPIATVVVPNGGFPIPPWVPDNATSAWIAPTANGGSAGTTLAPFVNTAAGYSPTISSPQGLFYYTTTFTIGAGSSVAGTSNLSWTSDNQGVAIFLNGHNEGDTNPGDFTTFTPFHLNTADFVSGVNTLTFVTFNEEYGASHASPTGLNAEGTILLRSIPEPGVMTLAAVAGLPLVGLGWVRRRRTA